MKMKLDTKTGVLILVAVALLVAIIVFAFIQTTSPQKQPAQSNSVADQVAAVVTAGNPQACSAFQNQLAEPGVSYATVCRNNIALQLAQDSQNISYCNNLDGQLLSVSDCERSVLLTKALQDQNVSACNAAPSSTMQMACVADYWTSEGLSKNDPSLCANIANTQALALCKSQIDVRELVKNPTMACGGLSIVSQSDCQSFESAMQNKNTASCSGIQNSLLRRTCLSSLQAASVSVSQ